MALSAELEEEKRRLNKMRQQEAQNLKKLNEENLNKPATEVCSCALYLRLPSSIFFETFLS